MGSYDDMSYEFSKDYHEDVGTTDNEMEVYDDVSGEEDVHQEMEYFDDIYGHDDRDDEDEIIVDDDVIQQGHYSESNQGQCIVLDEGFEPMEEEIFGLNDQLHVPDVCDDIKPKEGAEFDSYNEAIQMYRKYAYNAGFDIRQGTRKRDSNDIIYEEYLYCNRMGKPNTGKLDTKDKKRKKIKRRSDLRRTECMARIVFKIRECTQRYYVFKFNEIHNHKLISKENMYLSRTSRQLDGTQDSFVVNMSMQNVGTTKAFRLYGAIQGGYGHWGGLEIDFKNLQRNLNCFVGGRDAQMLIDKMCNRKENVHNFTFDVKDEDGRLDAIFWADDTAKFQYKLFGEVVSVDATYATNRYNMIFVPFTGLDNHRKCVTFGAGLISKENYTSFRWLLQAFLDAVGKPPSLILSDQCLGMKKAVKEVFPRTHHRLCMWHITSKLPNRLKDTGLVQNSEFKTRFHSLVWNSKLDESEFEVGWDTMLRDFNIANHEWLKIIYKMRRSWIPAYFKNINMSGLMKSTSLSESANWSFQNTTLTGCLLVGFMNTFDSAMERQRHNHTVLDYSTSSSFPRLVTHLPYESHAAKVFTRRVFYQVQKEIIHSQSSCFQKNVISNEGIDTVVILERKDTVCTLGQEDLDEEDVDDSYRYDSIIKDKEYEVMYKKDEHLFQCTCMNFEHSGVLCRHIFCVMKFYAYKHIPERYILTRWCRDIIPAPLLRWRFNDLNLEANTDKTAIEILSNVNQCVSGLCHDQGKFDEFAEDIKKLKAKYFIDGHSQVIGNKTSRYEKLLRVKVPDVINIQNPIEVHTKGSGSRGARIKSKKEIVRTKAQKSKRTCHLCKQLVHHDKRNCPLNKEKTQPEGDA